MNLARKITYVFLVIAMSCSMLHAQNVEWGFMPGLALTVPSKDGYSVVDMIDETYEQELNMHYTLFINLPLKNKWSLELQGGYTAYSFLVNAYYVPTRLVVLTKEHSSYRFVEFGVNVHYQLLGGKNSLNLLGGLGLGSTVRSIEHHKHFYGDGQIQNISFNFRGHEPDVQFNYQLGVQFMHDFDKYSIFIRPYYKHFTEEQFAIPFRRLSAYVLGVGIQF